MAASLAANNLAWFCRAAVSLQAHTHSHSPQLMANQVTNPSETTSGVVMLKLGQSNIFIWQSKQQFDRLSYAFVRYISASYNTESVGDTARL